jgi:hypothetical protein
VGALPESEHKEPVKEREVLMTRKASTRVLYILFLILFVSGLPGADAADMTDYCVVPPYVKRDIKPNVLIMMDNSYVTGLPAYKDFYYIPDPALVMQNNFWSFVLGTYGEGAIGSRYADFPKCSDGDPATLCSTDFRFDVYGSMKHYTGYFDEDLLYGYTNNRYQPSSTGVFHGEVMNWATTSMFDLIQAILVGGKSTSRQTNVNTLVGFESEEWPTKTYIYKGTDSVYYACDFRVNVGGKGNLTITDSQDPWTVAFFHDTTWGLNYASDPVCGLLLSPAVGPASTWTVNLAEAGFSSGGAYAALDKDTAEEKEPTLAQRALGLVNDIMSFFAQEAEAAKPVRITTPKNGATLPDAIWNSPYPGYIPAASGGGGTYTWSTVSLPAGFTLDASDGTLAGTPTAAPGTYIFTLKAQDAADSSNKDSISVTINILAAALGGAGTAEHNIRICVGDYTTNCTNTAGNNSLKSGILQDFWDDARFGFQDFANDLDPFQEMCIPASGDTNFFTAVENAIPVGDTLNVTKLIDGEYEAMMTYMGTPQTGSSCDPFSGDSTPCRNNFVLLLTSGYGADEGDPDVFGSTSTPPLPADCGSLTYDLSKNACYGKQNDLRSDREGTQDVITYIVNAMGTNGDVLREAASAGEGIYYDVYDPTQLKDKLIQAFQDIIKRASSGTAASVLASGEGSGANLIQAVYYPRKRFVDSDAGTEDEIAWIGRLTNFWFYVDPYFASSSMREETAHETPYPLLNLVNDYIASLYWDPINEVVKAHRYADTDGNGTPDVVESDINFENMGNIWEAGELLWERDLATDPRRIYANVDDTADMTIFNSSAASNATLRTYMGAASIANATALINYTTGYFINSPDYRDRRVKVDLNGDGDTGDTGETAKKVWKLGDILNSTPRIISNTTVPLNSYHVTYRDTTYRDFIESAKYVNRGMVMAGANDGMLHAFRLGLRQDSWSGQGPKQKVRLTGTNLGREEWAFIPKNVLPYLKYLTQTDYCHLYTVDLTPYIFDASIGTDPDGNGTAFEGTECTDSSDYSTCTRTANTWKTILIGGMRYGGACKNEGVSCTQDLDGDGDVDAEDCVNTPVSGVGYSSYFALDVTDPENPKFLWEFSNPALGYSTTGPAIVRISYKTDTSDPPDGKRDWQDTAQKDLNGRWYVVLGSGPTGPVRKSDRQFLGNSDQPLSVFVLDLKTGTLLSTIDHLAGGGQILNAFAGSMINVTADAEGDRRDYQDDVVYVPYVRKDTSTNTWTQGGILRLLTNEDLDPANWRLSTVIDGIGPVTSAVAHLLDKNTSKFWLFAGTGRYFYESYSEPDDGDGQRHLFGITDPCYSNWRFSPTCTTSRQMVNLSDVTTLEQGVQDPQGWYIRLDPSSGNYSAERVITDPLASISGIVFFTSFMPYSDICSIGGKSFIWAVRYRDGGAPGTMLKGTALIQVSTGAIEQVQLGDAFNEKLGRRSASLEGVPPTAQGFSLFTTPPPHKKTVHVEDCEQ